MTGDTSIEQIFHETAYLLQARNVSMTKEDIENMPPYEREAFTEYYRKRDEERAKQMKKSKGFDPSVLMGE
jgi:hypothetical protein